MAYNNQILPQVLASQQQAITNQHAEVGLGLQLAQFAENQKNTQLDQDYRKALLGEQKRATGVSEEASKNAVKLETLRYDGLAPQRAATLAQTKSATDWNDANAVKVKLETQNTILKGEGGLWWQHLKNIDGTDKKLDTPEAQEYFAAIINQPGLSSQLLTGSDGTQYKFKGIVDAGDGRRAIQIMDPKNPDKVMYMSRDRTAVEGDPLTAMDLMSFDILKSQVSIALHQADNRPLSNDLVAVAEGMNAVHNRKPDSPVLLDNHTVDDSAQLSQAMQASQQDYPTDPILSMVGTNKAPPNKVAATDAVLDPTTTNLASYSWDQLNTVKDVDWQSALAAAKKRMDTMREPGVKIDSKIAQNKARMEAVQAKIDTKTSVLANGNIIGAVPKALTSQMANLTKLGQLYSDRKAAGNDTFDAAQLAHNNLLDAKEVADGKKPAPTVQVKAATRIVGRKLIDPRQANNKKLVAAVEKEILKDPPTVAQVQQSLAKPMKMTPALLYQLHVAKAMGMIDKDAIARVADTGQLSASGVTLLQQQMMENTKIANQNSKNATSIYEKQMDLEGEAAKPKFNELDDGTLQALSSATGEVLWQTGQDITEGRTQAEQSLVMQLHNDEGWDGLDIEDSVTMLAQQMGVGTLPKLEANLLAQNLNTLLYQQLGVNAFNSPIDWFNGSDEDGEFGSNKYAAHNPMDNVTLRFAFNPDDGQITMYDQFGEPHGDRDYNITDLDNDALQKVLPAILQSPAEVEKRLIPIRLKQAEDELARRKAAGVK
jgi:hypothetical protein